VTIATHVHKVISEKIEVIKTIFHWHSTFKWERANLSPDCHCLLRIFLVNDGTEAIVIASDLYSDRNSTGVYYGYTDLVKTVIAAMPQLETILPQTTWLSHSGQFSAPLSWADSHKTEAFERFSVTKEPNSPEIEVKELGCPGKQEVIQLLKGANLEPVVKVLQQLEHDNHWDGIVDDKQVKLCLELEQGIILGEKRQAGLVGW
jgi:hypothetical protein